MAALALAGALFGSTVWANPHDWQLSMPRGVTPISHQVHGLYLASFWVCVGIGIVVFGAMIYAMVRFRKSKGAVAEKWSHSTKLELIWTIVPVLILIGLAWPATRVLAHMEDTTGSQMTVKVTGFQWKWRYDYVDYNGKAIEHVGFMSRLAHNSDKTRQLDSGLDPYKVKAADGENDYLLNVDHPLVVPVGVKIRFAVTGGDVIHSWWVPQLGWKMDAIPGIVNMAWAKIDKPGIYRGQCAELCGQDHGFMPIVVKAVPKAQFDKWLAAKEQAGKAAAAPQTASASMGAASATQG
ncbi:cytochrome c oxidase subunit II [Oleiagrimonas sp. C23AA]|uniref:cytochrome c oxidase subunit II n=1 Tax=Oleiagrimonas sp. C23AA TaxID=2719047 RepID=UPI001F0F00D7|nr:cytochrome c oxidase subunit II [Oleiagrimonas sp. C23AA]